MHTTKRRIRRRPVTPFCGAIACLLVGAMALASGAVGSESAPARRRIFTLEGGATVRAVGRQVDGAWEIQREGRWSRAPWSIDKVRLEHEVLAEMRAMAKRVTDEASVLQHCELADWMLRNGLLVEGLETLEPWLLEDSGFADRSEGLAAGHAGVSSTLARHGFRFAIPGKDLPATGDLDSAAALEPLLRFGAAGTLALRELCVQQVQADQLDRVLEPALTRDLVHPDARRRSWSAFALGRRFPGRQLPALLQRALLDSSEDVRTNAQWALRVAHEPALVAPIVRALTGSRSSNVRAHAAVALGRLGSPAAMPALVGRLAALEGTSVSRVPHANIFVGKQSAYLQDFDVEVSQGQSVADPQINVLLQGQVTDVGVVSVQQVAFERRAVRDSLERLTGAQPGRTSKHWAKWWEEHRDGIELQPRIHDATPLAR